MMKDPQHFNTALIPCEGPDCERWDDVRCIRLCRLICMEGHMDKHSMHGCAIHTEFQK